MGGNRQCMGGMGEYDTGMGWHGGHGGCMKAHEWEHEGGARREVRPEATRGVRSC